MPDKSNLCREEQVQDEDGGPGDLTGVASGHAGEFLCPTCRRISNILLPRLPPPHLVPRVVSPLAPLTGPLPASKCKPDDCTLIGAC